MGIFSFLEKRVSMAELRQELTTVAENAAQQIYFKELALQIAMSYIANTISKCEFKVFEGGQEVKNELYYMLNVNPNPNQNSSQFLNALITRYYRHGEVLVLPDTTRNRLYVADSFSTDEKPFAENIFSSVTVGNETLKGKYKASKVFYFRLDDIHIKKLIDGAFGQYGTIMQSAIDAYLRNNGKKYKLILDQYRAGDPEFNRMYNEVLKKQLEVFMTNPNVVYPQFKGTELVDMGTANSVSSSADIIAIRKEMFDSVAQAFKIPLSMMYGNITNIKDMINMFLTFVIDPLADMIGEEITRKMYDSFNAWKNGNYVKVDTSCISHVDILDVAANVSTAISSGVVQIDDMRKRLDMQPYDDEFGKMRFVTRNYATLDEVLTGADKPEAPPVDGNNDNTAKVPTNDNTVEEVKR